MRGVKFCVPVSKTEPSTNMPEAISIVEQKVMRNRRAALPTVFII